MGESTSGAEHRYLAFLEKIKQNPSSWIGCQLSLSRLLEHTSLVARRAFIATELEKAESHLHNLSRALSPLAATLPSEQIFMFADHDIQIFCSPAHDGDHETFREFASQAATLVPKGCFDIIHPAKDFQSLQAYSEKKFLGVKKMAAYEKLANPDIIESLPLLRKKRTEPLVLVVEDDRFTASYLSGFLKDFDLIVARTAEEAILYYLDHFPDAAFIDIHLPGLSGHNALQAIRAADPDAFVVMLSVDTTKQSILSACEYGAASYLKKPFSRERVLNTLRLSPFIHNLNGTIMPYYNTSRS
jgi:CheY-like chemotaxis protein